MAEPASGREAMRVRMQWGVRIPLRDGIALGATLYLPPNLKRPAPAIVTVTPYIGQRYHEHALYFAAHGYPFLTVDVRGRGDSEGEFRPLIQEGSDGYDVVEWLAQQPYCDGKVAMWGSSYMGFGQWITAAQRPPHLATIVPGAAAHIGTDFPIRNNIASTYSLQWLTLVSGRTAQDQPFSGTPNLWRQTFRCWMDSGLPFKNLDTYVGYPSKVFQEWISHPAQDEYWDRYNPTGGAYTDIALPVLTITGIYDSNQPGALTHYRRHLQCQGGKAGAHHYLVIGPWDHAGTRLPQKEFAGIRVGDAALVDLGRLHLEWYAWTMQSGPKPGFLKGKVTYYVLGAERWRHAELLDAITVERKSLYLDSSGSASRIFHSGILADEVGQGQPDSYVYDPRDLRVADLEAMATGPLALRPTFPADDLVDQSLVLAGDGAQLIYHSFPLEYDIEMSGFFALTAWISIDQPDTDIHATVYEVGSDGRSLLLSSDSIRARYREGFRVEKLVTTTDPQPYSFENFTFVSRLVRKGSRLRLVIGPINSIHFERNYNSGGTVAEETAAVGRPVTVQLFHDHAHPSILYVPLAARDQSAVDSMD